MSNGQFNSGATYVAVYELLLKIHNGTETKDGVSVKMSTEAYTDTDFVINTTDTTFRLPIKVKLASGNRVAGNNMTLGLTNGVNNFGVFQYASGNIDNTVIGDQSLYGKNVGTASVGNMNTNKSTGIGVTTDPTKSGIETSSSGLKLYFYVGETIQDANVIAASQVLTKVANGIDRTVATDRETVVGWGMPDYSARIQISSFPYTVTFKGWLIGQTSQVTENFIYVNDCAVGHAYNNYSQVQVPVDVGDVITITGSAYIHIYPMKGVN